MVVGGVGNITPSWRERVRLIADSGTAIHVAPSERFAIPGTIRRCKPFSASACFGNGRVGKIGKFKIDKLDIEVDMHIIEGAGMYLLCNHKLYVDHGIRFDSYTDPMNPAYELGSGTRVELQVKCNVPVLDLGIGEAVCLDSKKKKKIDQVKIGYIIHSDFRCRNPWEVLAIWEESEDDKTPVGAMRLEDWRDETTADVAATQLVLKNPAPQRYDPEIMIEHSARKISRAEIRKHNLSHAKSEK